MVSRLSGQLSRLRAPVSAPSLPAGTTPAASGATAPLEQLRAEMAAILGRERAGEPGKNALGPIELGGTEPGPTELGPTELGPTELGTRAWHLELPFLPHETLKGSLWVRRIENCRARHVGAIPVGSAAEADLGLLGLIGLCPPLGDLRPERLLYLDTETTGLGGAGALAFLVGLAFFDEAGELQFEQLFIDSPAREGALLEYLEARYAGADGLVTFNGKSFDWPLLQGRRVMNRLTPLPTKPHLDLLHLARRLHKPRLRSQRLIELEREVLGFDRGADDIPGIEIAPRYQHFLRSGDSSGLVPVIDHNAWDVYSMAALVGLYGDPVTLMHPDDLAQMAGVLGRVGSYDFGLELAQKARERGATATAERSFAQLHKAKGDRALALQSFEKLAKEVDDPRVRLELAKLYEHFTRDFELALETLSLGTHESEEALARRRQRLEQKRARAQSQAGGARGGSLP